MANAGFVIDDRAYEFPSRIRAGDWVLIEEVTGLEAEEYAEKIDELKEQKQQGDFSNSSVIRIYLGMMAVAIWQANPRWSREKVRRMVENLDLENVESVGGDDQNPPAETPSRSLGTSDDSTTTQADSQEDLG